LWGDREKGKYGCVIEEIRSEAARSSQIMISLENKVSVDCMGMFWLFVFFYGSKVDNIYMVD
jgi:hypothetical protein